MDNNGLKFQQGLAAVCRQIKIEIVQRRDVGIFIVLSRHRNVETTIDWLNRGRRLAKDWECPGRDAFAFLGWAAIRLMVTTLGQTAI